VVSDVHGNAEALKRAGDGADALLVLGDLVDFVDYHDFSSGILGAIFGPEQVARFAELRRGNRSQDAVGFVRSLWESLDDADEAVRGAVRAQYSALFAAMPAPTYAIPGNVDDPGLWPEFTGGDVADLDGTAVPIGGLRFGFVGGAVRSTAVPPRSGAGWRPHLRTEEELARALAGLGEVDILCTHVPPAIPELTYDVAARRPELGCRALTAAIEAGNPRAALFGHVHQPLAGRLRHGRTECVNVGHFQRTEQPYVLRFG
jgi:Icc-related predicted phosphoesterase